MNQLMERFSKEKSKNYKMVSKNQIKDEFYDYIFKVYFYSYIKKTITLTAIQIKKKTTSVIKREIFTLNTTHPNFNEERINLIVDKQSDSLKSIEAIGKNGDYKEISEDKNLIKAINTLTDKQKEIIYLCVLLGKRDTEVAKKLGITKQGVNKTRS